jgi:DNA-binding transcriptional ArsR family regulator
MGVVGDVFKALADPTRRAILDELMDRNGQTLFAAISSRLPPRATESASRLGGRSEFEPPGAY